MGEGEDRAIRENSVAAWISPYVKQMPSASLVHEAVHAKLVLWGNPEGWGGEGKGRRTQDGGHMCTRG